MELNHRRIPYLQPEDEVRLDTTNTTMFIATKPGDTGHDLFIDWLIE